MIDISENLNTLLNAVLLAAIPIIVGMVVMVLNAARAWLNNRLADSARVVVETAINNGIALEQSKPGPTTAAEVAHYVQPKVADSLKRLKVDPKALEEIIEAKIAVKGESTTTTETTEATAGTDMTPPSVTRTTVTSKEPT